MPDPSLLLAGIDKATAALLAQHHALGFRVNAFRHKVALDYNPTGPTVVQLVRLLQAECEAAVLGHEGVAPDKKARAAAARTEGGAETAVAKSPVVPKSGEEISSTGLKPWKKERGVKLRVRGKVSQGMK